jgi:glycosyltransferase involved in cell wall biosynthesis
MAVGLPCVATDVGDSGLLIGDAGMLVPKEDSVALAGALEKLANMTARERHEIGARARKRISENFSIDRIRRRYEDIYLKTAAGTLFENRSI